MGNIVSSAEIGWKLRAMRQQVGLTQEQLAEKVGVTSQQIQKYESGTNKLNTDRLQQVAQALSVPVHSFFAEGNETLPMEVAENVLVQSYRAIPRDDIKECILKLATFAANVSKAST